jgi:hypothetical protein
MLKLELLQEKWFHHGKPFVFQRSILFLGMKNRTGQNATNLRIYEEL